MCGESYSRLIYMRSDDGKEYIKMLKVNSTGAHIMSHFGATFDHPERGIGVEVEIVIDNDGQTVLFVNPLDQNRRGYVKVMTPVSSEVYFPDYQRALRLAKDEPDHLLQITRFLSSKLTEEEKAQLIKFLSGKV